jgi:arginase family enzyme
LEHQHLLQPKVFGVALDVSDDEKTLRLKHAYMEARQRGMCDFDTDPYDALALFLSDANERIAAAGKVSIPTWLSPRPDISDSLLVKKENMESFVASGGLLECSRVVKKYVKETILPDMPVMLGVDHSATGGVVSALCEALGKENLSILVLDQHFDGLPVSLRLEPELLSGLDAERPPDQRPLGMHDDDAYCCGNFWKHLIDSGTVCPEHLLFVGVSDYPEQQVPAEWEHFRNNYLKFEQLGCRFFPLKKFEGPYQGELEAFIDAHIATPYLYVSLDLDVGAYQCVHAARYMDNIGIDKDALMHIAHSLTGLCRAKDIKLVGLDVMEFNMHFLGLKYLGDKRDETLTVAADFIKRMIE